MLHDPVQIPLDGAPVYIYIMQLQMIIIGIVLCPLQFIALKGSAHETEGIGIGTLRHIGGQNGTVHAA